MTQPPHRGNSPQLKTVEEVNGLAFEEYIKAVRFETSPPLTRLKNSSWKPRRID